MLEVLYACGLRVSELVQLKISNLYLEIGFIRVIGKGNKERLVPIGEGAIKYLEFYFQERKQMNNIDKNAEDIVFLNRRGKQLTRNMVFIFVKNYCNQAGIHKNISPHTFRHSFATHLIEGGADLRVVQQLLGHESITTTEIYTHLDMQYLQETLRSFHPRSKR
jgi:integrase/recombinase XerD